jgi:hypothetical protein
MPLPTRQMMSTLGYSLDELALNRAGQVSSDQLAGSLKAAAVSVPLTLFAISTFLFIVFYARATGWHRALLITMSILSATVVGVLAYIQVADLITRKVATVEGPIEFTNVGKSPGIAIGHKLFETLPCRDVLVRGGNYRVYYLAHSNTFLSLEPLDDAAIPGGPGAPADATPKN